VLQPLLENAVYHGIEPLTEQGLLSINIFLSRDEVHAILKNPYVATGARHQVGNNMALDNIRERLALHFDAEASLESRISRDSWEVHIRMPYRTQKPAANGKPTTKVERPERGNDRGTHKRRQPRSRPLPATTATRIEPWLNPPCAS
jgi:two-component system sensor histidine kinase AlgZ